MLFISNVNKYIFYDCVKIIMNHAGQQTHYSSKQLHFEQDYLN